MATTFIFAGWWEVFIFWGPGCFTRRTCRHAFIGGALSGHASASLQRARLLKVGVLLLDLQSQRKWLTLQI